MVAVDAIGQPR